MPLPGVGGGAIQGRHEGLAREGNMKIDSREMEKLQASGEGGSRVDLYVGIHKALRALMSDVLLAVGRLDTEDESEFDEVSQRVLQLAEFCTAHLTHENEFVHTAMEARQPGASARIAQEHVAHGEAIAELMKAVLRMRACEGEARARAALALYRQLALFVAHNFEHMHVEETEHNGVLWAHYSDAELLDLHARLVASLPPQESLFVLRWMIPAMTPAERVQALADMRAHAPAPAFAAALDVVQPHLDLPGWAKLARGLALAPVAGLVAA